jgi:hypothetical protein
MNVIERLVETKDRIELSIPELRKHVLGLGVRRGLLWLGIEIVDCLRGIEVALARKSEPDLDMLAAWLELVRGDDRSLGEIGYAAYLKSSGGKTWDGKPCPPWSELGTEVRRHWAIAAWAIRRDLELNPASTHTGSPVEGLEP